MNDLTCVIIGGDHVGLHSLKAIKGETRGGKRAAALVHILLPYGVAYAAAGTMAASVVSDISSPMFLLASYKLRGESNCRERHILQLFK
ncbi:MULTISPECIES: hypothetical protein [Paenibacillus]|uniref:hypothetical protein n=1 Tax=Paenibacillus TaxID=44249 RepID=UPI0022B905C8|nr:hypothetical protein [Paenibacillus caseinilyticus]MCZ8520885.1 hypothetical protein [Paenibacillus caseinilyticus]